MISEVLKIQKANKKVIVSSQFGDLINFTFS